MNDAKIDLASGSSEPNPQDLLPCPFCGSSDISVREEWVFYVKCGGCGVCPAFKSALDAALIWNTRSTGSTKPARPESLTVQEIIDEGVRIRESLSHARNHASVFGSIVMRNFVHWIEERVQESEDGSGAVEGTQQNEGAA